MIKQINFLTLFFFIFCGITFNTYAEGSPSTLVENNLPPCVLNSPTNFHATIIGTDFIELGWNQSGTPPTAYNIRVIKTSTGALIYNLNFLNDGSHKILIPALEGGVTYDFILTPLCSDYKPGGPETQTSATTIILELTLVGINTTTNNEECAVTTTNGSANIWPSGTYCVIPLNSDKGFRIVEPGENGATKEFHISYNGRVYVKADSNNSAFQFYCGDETSEQQKCYSKTVTVKKAGDEVARFSVCWLESYPNEVRVYSSVLDTGYRLSHRTTSFTSAPDDRDATLIPATPATLSASPNPFTNTLEVKIPYATEENDVNISLYDLQGRLVLSEKTTGGTQIRSLSTAELLPGFYLLRVDTGDRSETIKVVKTQ